MTDELINRRHASDSIRRLRIARPRNPYFTLPSLNPSGHHERSEGIAVNLGGVHTKEVCL